MPPSLPDMLKAADAALLIGDPSFYFEGEVPRLDLGEEWIGQGNRDDFLVNQSPAARAALIESVKYTPGGGATPVSDRSVRHRCATRRGGRWATPRRSAG